MGKARFIVNYLIYRLKSVNEHGVHSPFVFDLLMSTVYNKRSFYAYARIEKRRKELALSMQKLECTDLGAGSKVNNKTKKSVQEILFSAAKPAKYSQLLFRLADHFQPRTVLELGTSLGISSAYLAAANSRSRVITVEGCEEIAVVAKKTFKLLELTNIEQVHGNFDEVLSEILKNSSPLDLVFFDGNHRKEPTLRYFKQCLEKANEKSVFIFDDIYWSPEMTEAWQEIKNHPDVTVSLDLFYLGIVFFRKDQVKEHFVIRY